MENKPLKSTLSIGIDHLDFANTWITIENTPVLPNDGEMMHIDWEDYIEDKSLVERLEAFEDNEVFMVHFVSRYYKKDRVITNIMLYSEHDYKELFGNPNSFKEINFNDVKNSRRINPNEVSTQ